jgi:hypothetical protein
MMLAPLGMKVHLALGVTDMRKGMDGLAMLAQGVLKADPFSGHLFAFRGRKANLIKILYWNGTGLCLFTKRLDAGRFTTFTATDECADDISIHHTSRFDSIHCSPPFFLRNSSPPWRNVRRWVPSIVANDA